MMVSTKGRYALRLMVDLALHDNGKFIALKDVSARQKISIKYLEQIVTPLNRAGLLKSGRGAQGGYRLAKNTQRIIPLEKSFGRLRAALHRFPVWRMRRTSVKIMTPVPRLNFGRDCTKVVNEYLDGTTLYDLVEIQKRKNGWKLLYLRLDKSKKVC